MTILEEKSLTLTEVYDLTKNNPSADDITKFIKEFIKLEPKKAKELKKELIELDLIKLKEIYITKIIDFLPKDSSELNKILPDISLDEAEINKILDVVKKY